MFTDTPSPVPDFATHVIGMGGMCINDRHEVLLVQVLPRAGLEPVLNRGPDLGKGLRTLGPDASLTDLL